MNELTVLILKYQLVTSIIDKSFLTIYSTSAHTDCMVKLLKNVDFQCVSAVRFRKSGCV